MSKIIIEEDPLLAVVIATSMMQRAHSLPLASKMAFIDTTSSCDSENHAITFLLTPCGAGAMALAVFITSGQRQADYETSFNLLKTFWGKFVWCIAWRGAEMCCNQTVRLYKAIHSALQKQDI
jgi:hypothetical protein